MAIFGAGIAGLTAAHELVRRGYAVTVYEANEDAGGFFRSARAPDHDGMPSEYSWHGLGPWYHNAFDIMQQIPMTGFGSTGEGTVYDQLSRPIDFGIASDDGKAEFEAPSMFRFTVLDTIRWAWLMLKTWSADERSSKHYSSLNASEVFRPLLSDRGWKTWRACWGPWVGSDWTRVSLHHVGQFFRRNMLSGRAWAHIDEAGAWTHGPRDGWLVFKRPSSEAWFAPWVAYLRELGVEFCFGTPLHCLWSLRTGPDSETISAVAVGPADATREVEADIYVLAISPFATVDILERSRIWDHQKDALLQIFRPLCQDGPHTQVGFRIAFREHVKWPGVRIALVCADTPWNLTLFAQEQAWGADVDLGDQIKSLWTGTACVSLVPGLNGLTIEQCTKEQFLDEVEWQLRNSQGFGNTIAGANGDQVWTSFEIHRIEVWHEWNFKPEGGLVPKQPKWVTSSNTQPFVPSQRCMFTNLVFAGAHTQTEADVWSIEGAVESGRRAAAVFEPEVKVLPQHKPTLLRWLSALDNLCYRVGAPHFLDLLACAIVATAMLLAILLLF